jgi:hypothetical protein
MRITFLMTDLNIFITAVRLRMSLYMRRVSESIAGMVCSFAVGEKFDRKKFPLTHQR